jgi:shikimate kinase
VDADAVLELDCGKSIRDIFATEGEGAFRDRETAVLNKLCKLRQHVIATGGGVVLRESNRQCMRASGWVVWLTVEVETIHQRLQGDASTWERRPALTAAPARAEIAELLKMREPHYRSCAHFIVPTEGRSPDEVAAKILDEWSARTVELPIPR